MFVDLKHRLSNIIYNIPGWRTKRHIVVIESDDWGAIRMPSRQVFDFLHRFVLGGVFCRAAISSPAPSARFPSRRA